MGKNQVIIALVVLALLGTIWGSLKDKQSKNLQRQLTAMKQTPQAAVPAVAPSGEGQAAAEAARAEAEELKSQNRELLAEIAALKENVDSQRNEIAALKKDVEGADSSQVIEAMQAKLDKASHLADKYEAALAGAKNELEEKAAALLSAEEAAAGFEQVKSSLANSVDTYSAKNQELMAEIEGFAQRVQSLESALEERTKRLVASGEELARTKLNMNVLLSKIAAQNNSLTILEETRIALEKELAEKFKLVEELQHRLSGQVIIEEVTSEEGAAPAEEGQEEQPREAPAN